MTVHQLVERERSRLRRKHLFAGVALAAAATCALLALGVSALGHARWMALPRSTPFMVWLVVLGVDAAILWWTWTRLVRAASRSTVAEEIEREQSLRAGALRGVLEIGDSGALGRRAAERMSAKLGDASRGLAPRTQRTALGRVLQTLAAAVIAALLLGWAAPVFGDGLQAILRPVHAWRGTLLPALQFKNLPSHVVRGEELTLEILAPGRSSVTLAQRMPGEAWKSNTIRLTGTSGIAKSVVGPVRGDLTLVASDGRSASDTFVVRVADRPFLGGVSMRALFPAYLGRPPEALPIGEPARVPQGTIIDITGRASTELARVRLASGSDTLTLQAGGHAFNGRIEARRSGRWNWVAAGTSGPISDLPLPVELEVLLDSAPHVEILAPTVDTVVAANQRIAMRLAAGDDHGIALVELRSWKQERVGEPVVITQRLAQNQSTLWSDLAELDLAPRDLQPGDVLHVRVVAIDNSPWAQRGESRELLLKVPTMEERRSIARDAADSAVREARSAVADQKALEKRTDDASKNRAQRSDKGNAQSNNAAAKGGDQQSMSYEAAEQARNVAKDQRALAERIQNLQKQAAALQEQLKAAGALDSSLARQLREAQDLLRQALTPELMAQMQKLEQATQKLEGEQAQQALKDLEAMQQRLREQLEKSAEMLKRAAMEGAMQTLKDEAKEIAERERKLADSTRSRSAEQQRNDAKNLADRSDRFGDDVKKLQERLEKDKASAGAAQTKEASQRADASEEKMRDLADDLQKAVRREQQQQQAGDAQKSEGQKGGEQQKTAEQQKGGEQQRAGQSQSGERKPGEGKPEERRSGEQKPGGEKQGDQQQPGRSGEQKSGGSQSDQQQPGGSPQKSGERQSSQGQRGQQSGQEQQQQQARDAASQMERAAQAMQDARDQQVQEWKKELTSELDRAIQETLQMAREESALEEKARSGQAKSEELRGQQSALKQGLDQTAQRLQQEGQKSSLLSGRSQRSVAEAQQKMNQAMQQLSEQRGGQQAAGSMGEAAEALNRVAASLARDREKANSASSASGFSEMLQQLQELAKKQGSINSQAQGLMPMPNGQMSQDMQATARALARQQRQVAQQLEEMNDAAGGDKAAQLAKEARQLAEALDGGRVDAATTARQQQLFRRLLDAGRTLEKDERDDSNKREAKSAQNAEVLAPENRDASGKAAQRFREPDWNELRGLTPDQRRAILEYFKRINAQNP